MVAEKTGADFTNVGGARLVFIQTRALCYTSPVGKAAKLFQDLGL